jgi:hypothetical protein
MVARGHFAFGKRFGSLDIHPSFYKVGYILL